MIGFTTSSARLSSTILGPFVLCWVSCPICGKRGDGHLVSVSPSAVPRFSAYLTSKSAFDSFPGVPLVYAPTVEAALVDRILPRLTADKTAAPICRAPMGHPRRVALMLGLMGRLIADTARVPFEGLLGVSDRWSTDSSAARREALDEVPTFGQGVLRHLEPRSRGSQK